MQEYDLNKLMQDKEFLADKIQHFSSAGILKTQELDKDEIRGHILKADHNLRFATTLSEEFLDWVLAGCYYASYHAALALLLTKGFTSKNHLATLCLLIRDFYGAELSAEDFIALSQLLDYEDILFYIESKNKREQATYSAKIGFNKKDVDPLKLKATLFVSTIKSLLKGAGYN
ncbi:MAG: hypothetical protein Q7K43_00385 [Candidatus Woesearchaeota archaeon]|nr:hypothetical protein [Candidatus Woesearchaeota archaeon]